MRRIFLSSLCLLLLASVSWCQTKLTLSPAVTAFVKEDAHVLALAHVRVVDGTGAAPRTDQTLIIEDGKIAALGDAATTKIPDGAKVLDLSGHTVIPGLVGMHDHMFYPSPDGGLPLYPEHAQSFPAFIWQAALLRFEPRGASNPIRISSSRGPSTREKSSAPKFMSPAPILKDPGLSLCRCIS